MLTEEKKDDIDLRTGLASIITFLCFFSAAFYLFVIYNRMSNAMDAEYVQSVVFLIAILPVLLGIFKGYSIAKNNSISDKQIYLNTVPTILTASIFVSIFLTVYMSYGARADLGMGMLLILPILIILIEMVVAILIVMPLVVFLGLFSDRRIGMILNIILITIFIILFSLNSMLVRHCNFKGCGNAEALAKIAISNDNKSFCVPRNVKNKDNQLLSYRFGMPLIFIHNSKDPSFYGDENCLKAFAENKNDISMCGITGYNEEKCITEFLKKNNSGSECEKLEPDDGRSFCYFSLANLVNDVSYCGYLEKGEDFFYNRETCQNSVAGDITKCFHKELAEPGPFIRNNNETSEDEYEIVLDEICVDAIIEKNPQEGECKKLDLEKDKNSCYEVLAKVSQNKDYCDKINDAFYKQSCLDQFIR